MLSSYLNTKIPIPSCNGQKAVLPKIKYNATFRFYMFTR